LIPARTALNDDELGAGEVGDEARQGRLAGARRAPEDDRLEQIPLDHLAQRSAGTDDLVLSDDLVQGARAHALGQRDGPRVHGLRGNIEQAHTVSTHSRWRAAS
jgi:hypothetical protein